MLSLYLTMLESEEDKITLSQLYEETKYTCLHVAIKITKDKAMAEDAVHNAFLEVIKRKDEIFKLSSGKRKSYIVIITKNKAIDLWRKENRRSTVPFEDEDNELSSNEPDIGVNFVNQESFELLIHCISLLPEIYKTAFELKYVHDMGNSEIAKTLSLTPRTVSMRIHRAKLKLQEIIEKEGLFDEP